MAAKPLPLDPEYKMPHNPTFTRMMKARGFEITGMGGNIMAYVKHDPTVGDVIVSCGDGWLPTLEPDRVSVYFMGLQHSEPMLTMEFPSLRAFAAVTPARPRP